MNYLLALPEQTEEIITLFKNTFSDAEGKEEGGVIATLVSDFLSVPSIEDDLHVFVAMDNARIVGSIILSRMHFPNGENVFLLSPVAVATDYHGQGIGQTLINVGLETLKAKGVAVVVTYGDINFYSKVGFAPINESLIQAPLTLSYPEGWIAQPLQSDVIKPMNGKPRCSSALNNPNYW
ncbi:N-acetyltransferase [Enterovibrio sp. ZSDZ42]|uniref:N-acetyltransferase n=1 Tax=Enterovibrio gelatinilyticus TaxID=2899819 RepID=A0ABT5R2J3_9GAMM|nr:N-acetyltransferase [Enterovibrio sp. ZSDZ42]MDD1794469.1 N-acetyltransferase [Enterovibrio sp. ZSDZ42]